MEYPAKAFEVKLQRQEAVATDHSERRQLIDEILKKCRCSRQEALAHMVAHTGLVACRYERCMRQWRGKVSVRGLDGCWEEDGWEEDGSRESSTKATSSWRSPVLLGNFSTPPRSHAAGHPLFLPCFP